MSDFTLGFNFFTGIKYAEFSLGYGKGRFLIKGERTEWEEGEQIVPGFPMPVKKVYTIDDEYDFTTISYSLILKYPFGDKNTQSNFQFFPLLGFEKHIFLSFSDIPAESELDFESDDFQTLWLVAGAGIDFSLGENMFIRTKALLKFRSESDFEKDNFSDDISRGWIPAFSASIAIGYKVPTIRLFEQKRETKTENGANPNDNLPSLKTGIGKPMPSLPTITDTNEKKDYDNAGVN
jgi:hypothetical protein